MNRGNTEGFILCTAPVGEMTSDQGESPAVETKPTDSQSFYDQFHPSVIVGDFDPGKVIPFESFDVAVDEFFSKIESQKLDMKQLNQVGDMDVNIMLCMLVMRILSLL